MHTSFEGAASYGGNAFRNHCLLHRPLIIQSFGTDGSHRQAFRFRGYLYSGVLPLIVCQGSMVPVQGHCEDAAAGGINNLRCFSCPPSGHLIQLCHVLLAIDVHHLDLDQAVCPESGGRNDRKSYMVLKGYFILTAGITVLPVLPGQHGPVLSPGRENSHYIGMGNGVIFGQVHRGFAAGRCSLLLSGHTLDPDFAVLQGDGHGHMLDHIRRKGVGRTVQDHVRAAHGQNTIPAVHGRKRPGPACTAALILHPDQRGIGRYIQSAFVIRLQRQAGGCHVIGSFISLVNDAVGSVGQIVQLVFRQLQRNRIPVIFTVRRIRQSPVCQGRSGPSLRIALDKTVIRLRYSTAAGKHSFRSPVKFHVLSRKVERQTPCIFHVGHMGHDRVRKGQTDRFTFRRAFLIHFPGKRVQVDQIKAIGPAFDRGQAESPGFPAKPGQTGELSRGQLFFHFDSQPVHRFDQRIDFGQIDQGQRDIRVKGRGPGIFIEHPVTFEDLFPQDKSRIVSCGRVIQHRKEMVIPAVSGFQFFRSRHVGGIGGPETGIFQTAHQAGVKPYKSQFLLPGEDRLFHGLPHLLQQQGILIKQFITAIAPDRTCSVVPEEEDIPVRRIIVGTEIHKTDQRGGMAHIRIPFCFRHDPVLCSRPGHIQYTVGGTGNTAVPFLGAARADNDIGPAIVHARFRNFPQVPGTGTKTGLQVGADHIDHDGAVFRGSRQVFGGHFQFLGALLLLLVLPGQGPVSLAVRRRRIRGFVRRYGIRGFLCRIGRHRTALRRLSASRMAAAAHP